VPVAIDRKYGKAELHQAVESFRYDGSAIATVSGCRPINPFGL
jgi:hypothetical protein